MEWINVTFHSFHDVTSVTDLCSEISDLLMRKQDLRHFFPSNLNEVSACQHSQQLAVYKGLNYIYCIPVLYSSSVRTKPDRATAATWFY